MKFVVLFIMILLANISNGQISQPFYEQIAFEFYATTILDSFPVKKKITVNRHAIDFHPNKIWFDTPECLSNVSWESNDQFEIMEAYSLSQMEIESNKTELDISNIDKKRFRIRKNGKGKCPKLFISLPYNESKNKERIFINIYEKQNRTLEYVYHLEFDKKGEIIEWCRTEFEVLIFR